MCGVRGEGWRQERRETRRIGHTYHRPHELVRDQTRDFLVVIGGIQATADTWCSFGGVVMMIFSNYSVVSLGD